jgi:hypothetical protein
MSEYVDKTVPQLRHWTSKYAEEYERSSIPCREFTDKKVFADFVTYLISKKERHKFLSGNVLEYGV